MLRSALPSPLHGFTCHPSVLAPALVSCHHAHCSPETTQHSFTFCPTLHPHGTALGTPPGPLGVPPHMLSCPPHGLHPRLSLIPSVPVPSLLHCPSCRNWLHHPPLVACARPCASAQPIPVPTSPLSPGINSSAPHAPTSHTAQRLPTAPPASLTVPALAHTMLLRPTQFQPSGHGALRRRGLGEVRQSLS